MVMTIMVMTMVMTIMMRASFFIRNHAVERSRRPQSHDSFSSADFRSKEERLLRKF